MTTYNIIVCDDRPEKVDMLQKVCFVDVQNINIVHVNSLEALCGRLQGATDMDAVFLDLFFGNKESTPDILKVEDVTRVRELCGLAKLIIYTVYSTPETNDLMKVLLHKRLADFWLDSRELEENPGKKIVEIHELLGIKDLIASAGGLWLLHMSDLHFGKTFNATEGRITGKLLGGMVCEEIRAMMKGEHKLQCPHLAVLSGDGTFGAAPGEFSELITFLRSVQDDFRRLGGSRHNSWAIVPGNHDLNWNLSIVETHEVVGKANSSPKVGKRSSIDRSLEWVKWLHFEAAIGQYLSASHIINERNKWTLWDYSHELGVCLVGYNTSQHINFESGAASIQLADLDAIETAFNRRAPFCIFVTHHSLMDAVPDAAAREMLVKALFERLNVRLILRGDRHRQERIPYELEGGSRILELGVASGGVDAEHRPVDVQPGFQVLHLVKNNAEPFAVARIYRFELSMNRFKLVPLSGGKPFDDLNLRDARRDE
jgi:hypothetical protein